MNTDGFVRRRRVPPQLTRRPSLDDRLAKEGVAPNGDRPMPVAIPNDTPHLRQRKVNEAQLPLASHSSSLQLDIEDILRPTEQEQKRKWWPFGKRQAPQGGGRLRTPRKKIIKRVVLLLLALLLIGIGFFGWNLLNNTSRVFRGNVFGLLGNKPLKTDKYGRTNILAFGTSENDPGHPGADLTDSIMFISLDQKKHDAFIVSVPRDLWVKIPGCSQFSEEKINAIYECFNGSMGKGNEMEGQQALREEVGQLFGIDLQYSIHLNLEVLKGAVDAVGGIDITIQGSDPRGILDRNFDWRCGYKCYLVKYPNGPAHLDGTQAMWLAQARNDAGGYGLSRSNFDREENQRKILLALKDKATSIGFLANPAGVLKLFDSFGNNVHTNIDTGEIRTFIDAVKTIDSKNIDSVGLADQTPPILVNDTGPNGSSIVRPVRGRYDYSDLSTLTALYSNGGIKIAREKAPVDVFNASGVAGVAQQQADTLKANGVTIGVVGNTPAGNYGKVTLYDLTKGDKPATKQKLEQQLGVTAVPGPLPASIKSTASFVVVVGQQTTTGGGASTDSGSSMPSLR